MLAVQNNNYNNSSTRLGPICKQFTHHINERQTNDVIEKEIIYPSVKHYPDATYTIANIVHMGQKTTIRTFISTHTHTMRNTQCEQISNIDNTSSETSFAEIRAKTCP